MSIPITPGLLLPEDCPTPAILDENDDFLVVDKPANLLSHPTRLDGQPSLITWLRAIRPDAYLTLLHRLDRETSGVILVAKHPATVNAISRLMEGRQIEKEYEAVCWGAMGMDYVEIDARLGFVGISEANPVKIKQGVVLEPEGAAAHTKVWRVASGGGFSHLRIQPKTGRLHQIRVHLSLVSLPVVGDKIYGPDAQHFLTFIDTGWTPELERALLLPRHALHACRLRFRWGARDYEVKAPLPADLRAFIAARITTPVSPAA
ncbi:23S rRNA pseudouridine1911/1915/1917 synthase [Verrucomicrobium sp. GAS474]|uniref:RluA family pseudouridine synthase n=1 Tax=Verrucomicrobium sp. GAS474 TaxID=1882831 RepID=UPI00087DD1EC|nr:RluA family pseudouridine synthase [Verrucomicrobium sp. GAS474]SDT85921.1 23S rRNA pseudouridine1911/1915/1917 synthase [Verrucomicrobium sp. GAS474]